MKRLSQNARPMPTALLVGLAIAAAGSAPAAAADCFQTLAQTRNFTLGQPQHVQPMPDGRHVLFLRSGPRDTRLALYEADLQTQSERALATPAASPETLSAAEKARRERARMTLSGITDFSVSDDGSRVMVTEGDRLLMIALPSGAITPVAGGGWIAPRLSPDGHAIAVVRDNDLHVLDLDHGSDRQITHGGTDSLTHGTAEFAAAEELDRADGSWWSPDGGRLLVEEADSRGVEEHYIGDPLHPSVRPTEFRYPRAGTANARVRFGLVSRHGGAMRWIALDQTAWPYVARVVWPRRGALSLVVLDRAQTHEALLAVDPRTGTTRTLLTETDPAWINTVPISAFTGKPLPAWLPDGSGFLWAAERGATWQLELHHADGTLDHAVTPKGFRLEALDDFDPSRGTVVVTANPDRTSFGLYQFGLGAPGAPMALATAPGLHHAVFSDQQHSLFADSISLADGSTGTLLLDADGNRKGMLQNRAEVMGSLPAAQYLTAGPQQLDARILRPADFVAGRRYPVVLSVYAGPGYKIVERAARSGLEDQCLADHGFIVVSLDGRGTPGRDHDFERATRGNLIDLPLADQVEGLQALGRQFPEMDMRHVGVSGWSFGGYFTAMATIRRPDVFAAGVAGAPVVDFADYDTAYTERYLGTPVDDAAGYKASNVLTYAATLSRPLLIMHGLTDDNVYFENSMKLTQALLVAGRPYQLLLLPGTHQLPDPLLREHVDETRAAFLRQALADGGHSGQAGPP